jgi:hypothetical protein
VGGGDFTDGDKGTLADAVENRSGVVDRVRPLPIQSIMAFLSFCGKSAPESWHPEKAPSTRCAARHGETIQKFKDEAHERAKRN